MKYWVSPGVGRNQNVNFTVFQGTVLARASKHGKVSSGRGLVEFYENKLLCYQWFLALIGLTSDAREPIGVVWRQPSRRDLLASAGDKDLV